MSFDDEINWKVGDRGVVTASHYYKARGTLIYLTVTDILAKNHVTVKFDAPARSQRTRIVKMKTWLSTRSIKPVSLPEASVRAATPSIQEVCVPRDDNETQSFLTPDPPSHQYFSKSENGRSHSEQLQLDNCSSLDDHNEVPRNVKKEIRRLCRNFQTMGFQSNSLKMLALIQIGMREIKPEETLN